MQSVRLSPLAALASALVLTACGSGSSDSADDPSAAEPSPTETTVQPTPPASTPARGAAAQSVADLATTLGVDASEVEVVGVEEVTWRDGSRGCAKPGEMYTQALVDGSRITLRVGRTTYEYHAGGSQPPALCEKPTE